jgi:hypothetical protein
LKRLAQFTLALLLLLTPRLDRRNTREVGGQLVFRKCLDVHFDQAGEGAAVVWSLAPAAVNDHANPGDPSAVGSDNVHCFLDAPAASHDVFGHNESLVRPNLKTASQDETARFLFHKNMAFSQSAADFLAHDNPAEGRGDDGVAFDVAKFISQPSANLGRKVCVLKQQGALEKLPAVKAGTQNEMPVKKSAGFSKKCQQILAH